jgi:hypothetical protein
VRPGRLYQAFDPGILPDQLRGSPISGTSSNSGPVGQDSRVVAPLRVATPWYTWVQRIAPTRRILAQKSVHRAGTSACRDILWDICYGVLHRTILPKLSEKGYEQHFERGIRRRKKAKMGRRAPLRCSATLHRRLLRPLSDSLSNTVRKGLLRGRHSHSTPPCRSRSERELAHGPARLRGSSAEWPGTLGPSDLKRPVVPPQPCVRATDVSSFPPCRVIPAEEYVRASVARSVRRRIRFGRRREWLSESRAWRIMQNLSFASSPSNALLYSFLIARS